MPLDKQMLSLLACPTDRGPLLPFENDGFLYNPRLKRKYVITDGFPNLLEREAVQVSAQEHDSLLARARAEGITPNWNEAQARR